MVIVIVMIVGLVAGCINGLLFRLLFGLLMMMIIVIVTIYCFVCFNFKLFCSFPNGSYCKTSKSQPVDVVAVFSCYNLLLYLLSMRISTNRCL